VIHIGRSTQMHLPLFKRVLHLTKLRHDAGDKAPRDVLGPAKPGAASG
jgi:hypothetical protein